MYGETFYGRHTALTPAACSKVKAKKSALRNKEHITDRKRASQFKTGEKTISWTSILHPTFDS